MSNSIHTTRHQLEHELRYDASKDDGKIHEMREELKKKQRYKAHERKQRLFDEVDFPRVDPLSIPIIVSDESKYVHYPASADDIRAILGRLPGIYDGISEIRFCLGMETQTETNDEEGYSSADPLTGRIGYEALSGIYYGCTLGRYYYETSAIEIYAFVYDADSKDVSFWLPYLRFKMLNTFVHEIAHHFDYKQRRGMLDSKEKKERYALSLEYEWMRDIVENYLTETYPIEVQQFEEWMTKHGGIAIPFSKITGDPRMFEDGEHFAVLSVEGAIEYLAEDVANEETTVAKHLRFANSLHMAEHYDEAMEILNRLLDNDPCFHKALILKADIFVHQDRYEDAESIIGPILSSNPNDLKALNVRRVKGLGSSDWNDLLKTTNHALSLIEPSSDYWHLYMRDRAKAKIELRDHTGAEEDLSELEKYGGKHGVYIANFERERAYINEQTSYHLL